MEKKGLLRNLAILLTIFVIILLMYFGKNLLVPLATAGMLAMMLNPLLNLLLKRGFPKPIAIGVCILTFLSFFGVLATMLWYQVGLMLQDGPAIEDKVLGLVRRVQTTLRYKLDIPVEQQKEAVRNYFSQAGSMAGGFVGSVVGVVAKFFLMIIYLILLLGERDRLKEVILKNTREDNRENARALMDQAVQLTGKYLISQLKVMCIIALLYSAGFYFGGVPYAVFLAVLAAVFAIIPFLGNIIGGGIACLFALVTGTPADALTIVLVIVAGQLLSDYILQPLLIGGTVDLSPLVTIFSIVMFSFIWGAVGAILALPIMACLVAWLRLVPSTQALGEFLSSNNVQSNTKRRERIEKIVHRRKKPAAAVGNPGGPSGK